MLGQTTTGDATIVKKLVTWKHEGESYRGITALAITNIADQPPAIVALAINIEQHRAFLYTLHRDLWLAITAGIMLTVILGWIAARRGLAPVRVMTHVAQGISASHLDERMTNETIPTELVDLANAFNGMLIRLEDSFQRLSEFSSDLAHEIRTPISNLMTQTQVALSRERSAEEYREVLFSNLEEYERLARMVADMLFLAKADNGLFIPNSEAVDLATEVHALFGFYDAVAEEQHVSLVLDGTGSVQGDRLMLRRAFSNLLSNAIRHSPQHATVKVTIKPDLNSGTVELDFANQGEDIPQEHLPRLFDRFYRADPSRHKTSDGAGLGLAITKSIIEAHKGKISVFSVNGVASFKIMLPIADQNKSKSS